MCDYDDFKAATLDQMTLDNFMEICGSLYYKQSSLRTVLITVMIGIILASISALVLAAQSILAHKKIELRQRSRNAAQV